MSSAVGPLKSDPDFIGILTLFDNPLLGFLAGTVLAAIIQSCSAGVGILQALSVTGVLSYHACVPLIMGINMGACTPVLLAMVGSDKNGRRAAVSYVVSSLCSVVVIFFLYYLLRAVGLFTFMDDTAGSVGIAIFNTASRVFTVLILTPLHKLIEKLCYRIIPFDPAENADSEYLDKLTDSALHYPGTAVNLSIAAVHKMAELAQQSVADAIDLLFCYDKATAERVANREALLDKYEDKLGSYMMWILANESFPNLEREAEKVLGAISDLERLGDHAMNIAELAAELQEKKLMFSDEATEELQMLSAAIREIVTLTNHAFCGDDVDLALQIEPLEEVIDILCDELKLRHISRLQAGRCTIGLGFIFNDLVTNYERISDHCSNLGICTIKQANPRYMPHEYSSSAEESVVYTEHFLRFTEKYVSPL